MGNFFLKNFLARFGTPPPLQYPPLARDGLPGEGGRRSPSQVTVSRGRLGDCKGLPSPHFYYNLKKNLILSPGICYAFWGK